jgi:HK97 family phage major capsid protein/HK97 family phage prohead protease
MEFKKITGYRGKAFSDLESGIEFVMSSSATDRMGEVILPEAWNLSEFKNNPICLYQHDPDEPIGRWEDVRVENGQLIGKLVLADKGTSDDIDCIRELVDQGILKAVSVGFMVNKWEYDEKSEAMTYVDVTLLECSLVSIPANPECMSIAKKFNANTSRIFRSVPQVSKSSEVETPAEKQVEESILEEPQSIPLIKEKTMNVSQRIEATESKIALLKETLETKGLELSANPDDATISSQSDSLMAEIGKEEANLERFKKIEGTLARDAMARPYKVDTQPETKAYSAPAIISRQSKSFDGLDLFGKMASVAFVSQVERKTQDQVISERYKGMDEIGMVMKAVQNPAMTSVEGYAKELVANVQQGFMEALKAESALARMPLEFYSFGQWGSVTIPVETDAGSTLDGAWISEADPIPVGKTTFRSVTMRPYKLARITTMSREILQQSNPQIEQILRNALLRRCAVKLDKEFFGAGAGVETGRGQRPAGLMAGLSANDTIVSSGNALENIVADITSVMARQSSLLLGQRQVWVMNNVTAMKIGMIQTLTGAFLFKGELDSGKFFGSSVITSQNIDKDKIYLIDASAVAFAGDAPIIESSDVATLHEEDDSATVNPIAPASGTASKPVRSLWQTNTSALKLTNPVSWAVTRAGAVQVITGFDEEPVAPPAK